MIKRLVLSLVIMVLLLATIFHFIPGLLELYQVVDTKKQNLKEWKLATQYGVFYPILIGNDREEVENNNYLDVDKGSYDLYPVLNNQYNAIYIDSRSYEQDSLRYHSSASLVNIKVNPNYLNAFPIYDENGETIKIDESNNHTIYLVPEQYKSHEKDIMEVLNIRADASKLDNENFNMDTQIANQIDIIYTKDNQNIFSFNSEVFPENQNKIQDPIIKVMTLSNSFVSDRFILSLSPTIFIKLTDDDAEKTYASLSTELSNCKLDDNLPAMLSVNDFVEAEISSIRDTANIRLLIIAVAVFIFIVVLILNIHTIIKRKVDRE